MIATQRKCTTAQAENNKVLKGSKWRGRGEGGSRGRRCFMGAGK